MKDTHFHTRLHPADVFPHWEERPGMGQDKRRQGLRKAVCWALGEG